MTATMTEIGTCPTCGGAFRHTRRMIPWGNDVSVPCDDAWHDVEQLELDITPLIKPVHVEGESAEERFWSFHKLNPWVLETFEKMTVNWLEHGNKKCAIAMLMETLRWEYGRATQGDVFRLNNNHKPFYVRLMVARHPKWKDVFDMRDMKNEPKIEADTNEGNDHG